MTRKTKDRIEKFCREYIIDLNALRAAERAGYSPKTSKAQGCRLLTKRNVQERIAQLQKIQCDKLDITAERVLSELAKLAYANMQDYLHVEEDGRAAVDLSKVSRDQFAAVQEIKSDTTGGSGDGKRELVVRTTLKLADKGANLERLGRHLKLFTDRIEHSGLDGLAEAIQRVRDRKNAHSN